MDGAQAINKRIRCLLENALRKTLKAAQKAHQARKARRIEFGRAEYLPFATHEVKQGDVIEVDGVAWKASKAIIVAADALILTRGKESRMLTGAATAIGCGGVALGAFLVLLVQGLAASSTGPHSAHPATASAPPALALTIPSSVQTASPGKAGQELPRSSKPPSCPPTSLSCIAAGGTGDPCHTLMAEDYTNLRSALR